MYKNMTAAFLLTICCFSSALFAQTAPYMGQGPDGDYDPEQGAYMDANQPQEAIAVEGVAYPGAVGVYPGYARTARGARAARYGMQERRSDRGHGPRRMGQGQRRGTQSRPTQMNRTRGQWMRRDTPYGSSFNRRTHAYHRGYRG